MRISKEVNKITEFIRLKAAERGIESFGGSAPEDLNTFCTVRDGLMLECDQGFPKYVTTPQGSVSIFYNGATYGTSKANPVKLLQEDLVEGLGLIQVAPEKSYTGDLETMVGLLGPWYQITKIPK